METLITITTLYFVFQICLFTWAHLMDKEIFSLRAYKISLIPGFGILYIIFKVIKDIIKNIKIK